MVRIESNLKNHSYRDFRDLMIKKLAVRDIGAMSYYPLDIGSITAYKEQRAYPRAEKQSCTNLGLPMYPELTKSEIYHVVAWFVDIAIKLYNEKAPEGA